jgi:hypothetical protein
LPPRVKAAGDCRSPRRWRDVAALRTKGVFLSGL